MGGQGIKKHAPFFMGEEVARLNYFLVSFLDSDTENFPIGSKIPFVLLKALTKGI